MDQANALGFGGTPVFIIATRIYHGAMDRRPCKPLSLQPPRAKAACVIRKSVLLAGCLGDVSNLC